MEKLHFCTVKQLKVKAQRSINGHKLEIAYRDCHQAVLELRGGGLGGPGPLSSGSAADLHYRLALRARHKAPLKTFK